MINNKRYFDDYPDILTPQDCMHILSIGRSTLYQLLRSGTLPSIRIGKQYRISKKCLQDFINGTYT